MKKSQVRKKEVHDKIHKTKIYLLYYINKVRDKYPYENYILRIELYVQHKVLIQSHNRILLGFFPTD